MGVKKTSAKSKIIRAKIKLFRKNNLNILSLYIINGKYSNGNFRRNCA